MMPCGGFAVALSSEGIFVVSVHFAAMLVSGIDSGGIDFVSCFSSGIFRTQTELRQAKRQRQRFLFCERCSKTQKSSGTHARWYTHTHTHT